MKHRSWMLITLVLITSLFSSGIQGANGNFSSVANAQAADGDTRVFLPVMFAQNVNSSPEQSAPGSGENSGNPSPPSITDKALAFPGAMGYGVDTPGGRGGKVLYVTNLSDSGTGSLRAALTASGARTVVFKVSGTITLKSDIKIDNPYLTIAGQTAPGEGVQIRGGMLNIRTHDVIIRYLKLRPGDEKNNSSNEDRDAISLINTSKTGKKTYNIVIDHVSAMWGPDVGAVAILDNVRNVTVSNSILGPGLFHSNHSEGDRDQGHGYTTNIYEMTKGESPEYIAYHHNLLTSSNARMPRIVGGKHIDFVNNVVYNWHNNSGHGNPYSLNLVKNYFVRGPESDYYQNYAWRPIAEGGSIRSGVVYAHSNITDGFSTAFAGPNSHYTNSRFSPFPFPSVDSADVAYNRVVADAGANRQVSGGNGGFTTLRDSVDKTVINNLTARKGSYVNGVGYNGVSGYPSISWPKLAGGTAANDSDNDGMADAWEKQYFGSLKRGSASSSSSDYDGDGYTDLEEYLNGTNPTVSDTNASTVGQTTVTPEVIEPTPVQAEPTLAPTAQPTTAPTAEPTAAPTAEPTAAPTAEPTAVPTAEPTAEEPAPTEVPVESNPEGPLPAPVSDKPLAFPGAMGYGIDTPGGRGGKVLYVTNLNDSGTGSLRAALTASGARTVVFMVSGTIALKNDIKIDNPYLTIAGQAAPGEGVQIRGGMLNIRTHDVIIRYLKLRPGDEVNSSSNDNRDAISLIDTSKTGNKTYNIVIDHVSAMWGPDVGAVAILDNVRNVTVSYSILGPGLFHSNHSEGSRDQGHGYTTNIYEMTKGESPENIAYHHNLLTSSNARMPRIVGGKHIDFVNNVVYNWHNNSGHGNPYSLNLIKNYFLRGPESDAGDNYAWRPIAEGGSIRSGVVYAHSNITDGFSTQYAGPSSHYAKDRFSPFPFPSVDSAGPAYDKVMADAGANRQVSGGNGGFTTLRDSVDSALIKNVISRSGSYVNGVNHGGKSGYPSISWPKLAGGTAATDSDKDGMADAWEKEYFGSLEFGSASSSKSDYDGDGYTDLEEYLNGTNPTSPDTTLGGQVSTMSEPVENLQVIEVTPAAVETVPEVVEPTGEAVEPAPEQPATELPATELPATELPATAQPAAELPAPTPGAVEPTPVVVEPVPATEPPAPTAAPEVVEPVPAPTSIPEQAGPTPEG